MLDDDFLKEKQNIRQKMLKFSRAVNQGKPLDDDLKEEISSDDILRRRFKKRSNHFLDETEEDYKLEYTKKSNIYLKEVKTLETFNPFESLNHEQANTRV